MDGNLILETRKHGGLYDDSSPRYHSQGHLVGTSTLNSDCLRDVRLEATVQGSQITLNGSDDEGDSITIQGALDATGTTLKANFTLNGSASGRRETDSGTANMAKR